MRRLRIDMRIVIDGIKGKDLVLLMYILERLDFDNKEHLMEKWKEFLRYAEMGEKRGETT